MQENLLKRTCLPLAIGKKRVGERAKKRTKKYGAYFNGMATLNNTPLFSS
jgi:hypothetical protein